MRLLLDTQILVWLITDRTYLSKSELRAIADQNELLVSAVSLFELRIKARAERRRGLLPSVPSPLAAIAFCEVRQIDIHPLLPQDTTVELMPDTPHGDPFDEMLLAHASVLPAYLLTRDRKLLDHPLAYRA